MPLPLAALTHSTVAQLRDAIRRVTAQHTHQDDQRDEAAFLASVEVSDSSWGEWEEHLPASVRSSGT